MSFKIYFDVPSFHLSTTCSEIGNSFEIAFLRFVWNWVKCSCNQSLCVFVAFCSLMHRRNLCVLSMHTTHCWILNLEGNMIMGIMDLIFHIRLPNVAKVQTPKMKKHFTGSVICLDFLNMFWCSFFSLICMYGRAYGCLNSVVFLSNFCLLARPSLLPVNK